MKKMIKMSIAAAMMMGVGAVSAQAEGFSIADDIYVKGEIRPRYEMVEADDNGKANANAFTNRLVIGVGAKLGGTDWLSAYAEMTDVHNLNDNYNSTDNGETGHQIVADPEQTRLTQSYLDIKVGATKLRAGRQMINLDNQRFVGAVGWRQMPQTFDAYMLTNNSVDKLNLAAVYITQVNTIKADASFDTRTVLLNASYAAMPALKVTAYAYMIGSLHDTYGLSLTGKPKISDALTLNYRAEYATQDDSTMENSGANEGKADADWYNVNVGMNFSGFLAAVGYESLSGAGGGSETAFTTPLATLHAHNGWADKFLATPAAGLEDTSVMLGYKAKGFGLFKAVYHDFSSEVGSTDYGTEIDAVYKNKIPGIKGLSGMLKVADFSEDDNSGYIDTTKFWVMLDYKFSTK